MQPFIKPPLSAEREALVLRDVKPAKLAALLAELEGNFDVTAHRLYNECLDAASKTTAVADWLRVWTPLVGSSSWPVELRVVPGSSDAVDIILLDCRRGHRPSTTDSDVPLEVNFVLHPFDF